ncbi:MULTISPECIES: F0F1 ATP synthase subunit B [Gammaproteobacteria]|uniref:ATP synthase subunit b n=1 Tax=Vreelandella halophila TaxID=86177 RepID=A0A9X5B591_9GAMM|nr:MULTISPECIES: F0F1 ATP synthase subunit B [Gammaproteobacteria]KAA8982898.1 F0F1 ATP synthase subunit B [Halospina sp. K52047b]MYL25932.1 F0F1 ATP synthase subunit B [Halomonas utahensis]MYL73506.1 F0F1 ATP synthase subunit B [Halomonas sp. 22501_18_FS]
MNINLTMIGQTIGFFIFIAFCVKYVWPPLVQAMQDRQKKIADGLAASDRANQDLELAQQRATQELREARDEAATIVEKANKRANQIVEEAKTEAREQGDRLLAQARDEIEQERQQARDALRAEVATLAIAGAEKILESSVDAKAHSEMLDKLSAEL